MVHFVARTIVIIILWFLTSFFIQSNYTTLITYSKSAITSRPNGCKICLSFILLFESNARFNPRIKHVHSLLSDAVKGLDLFELVEFVFVCDVDDLFGCYILEIWYESLFVDIDVVARKGRFGVNHECFGLALKRQYFRGDNSSCLFILKFLKLGNFFKLVFMLPIDLHYRAISNQSYI